MLPFSRFLHRPTNARNDPQIWAEMGDLLRPRHETTHEARDLIFVHAAIAMLDERLHGRASALNADRLDPEEDQPGTDSAYARGRDCAGRVDADFGVLARCAAFH